MIDRLKHWWSWDPEFEKNSADNPLTALTDAQRRGTGPLLTLAFGWGFLVTGLIVGGLLGSGMPFWPEIALATFFGNLANFVIGAVVGYIGYRTACNSGLLYRYVYGRIGAYLPVLVIALLTIGWQGIVVGAFGFAWAQSFTSPTFYAVAVFAGLLFTVTTYFGVRGLELVSVPAVVILVAVGGYAAWLNIDQAGGLSGFLELSRSQAGTESERLTLLQGINIVIGSWIVGAIVMPEYTRFARKAWVAIAIPFIVLMISQWFLQGIGALGGVVSGTHDFTTYLLAQGMVVGGIGLIGMSLALWTTGDANLYLPVIQTASVFRRPQHVMTVICGLLGTLLGLGIYQQFASWIELLAVLVPPLIGPVIVDYYVVNRGRFRADSLDESPTWNPAAFIAYLVGAISTNWSPDWTVPALFGLIVSMLVYAIVYELLHLVGFNPHAAGRRGTAASPTG